MPIPAESLAVNATSVGRAITSSVLLVSPSKKFEQTFDLIGTKVHHQFHHTRELGMMGPSSLLDNDTNPSRQWAHVRADGMPLENV